MSDLGIFIDESGDVGTNSDFYIIALVLHDQGSSIVPQIMRFESELRHLGISPKTVIHAGPIMRKEGNYKEMALPLRRKILSKMFAFIRTSQIRHKSFSVDKRRCHGRLDLKGKLSRELGRFLNDNLGYFQSFETVIIYYDNGQAMVTDLINTVFNAYLSHVDIRKISHIDYRLSQSADLICSLELLRLKDAAGMHMNKSEEIFFESRRRLARTFLKSLERMSFDFK